MGKRYRGRHGQYKVLKADERTKRFTTEQQFFTEDCFYSLLKRYEEMIIKPLSGHKSILVSVHWPVITVSCLKRTATFHSAEEAFRFIQKQMDQQKRHVITPFPHSSFHGTYTLFKRTPASEWKAVHHTGHHRRFSRIFSPLHRKCSSAAKQAAQALGSSFPDYMTITVEIAANRQGVTILDTELHGRNSKWTQYHMVRQHVKNRKYVPATDLCTRRSISTFLSVYREVILKPAVGQSGRGIVKITYLPDGKYETHHKGRSESFCSLETLYSHLHDRFLSKKTYLIQRYIPLMRHEGNVMDIRVITQRVHDRYTVPGMLCRVAGDRQVATNYVKAMLTVEEALSATRLATVWGAIEKKLSRLSVRIAKIAETCTDEFDIAGYDFGLTDKGEIYFIEINYAPSLSMFYGFDGKEIYKRIYENFRIHRSRFDEKEAEK